MPEKGGLEVVNELQARGSAAKVLVLTMHDSRDLATALETAGAKGYVVKSHAARDLAKAIQTIADGGGFFFVSGPPAVKSKKSEKKFPFFRVDQALAFG
jgi:DNA-binding NarL/FixJ family response regulator